MFSVDLLLWLLIVGFVTVVWSLMTSRDRSEAVAIRRHVGGISHPSSILVGRTWAAARARIDSPPERLEAGVHQGGLPMTYEVSLTNLSKRFTAVVSFRARAEEMASKCRAHTPASQAS